jgi:hypothetical protein
VFLFRSRTYGRAVGHCGNGHHLGHWCCAAKGFDASKCGPMKKVANTLRDDRGLENDRKGHQSIRINDRSRICFRWTSNGPQDLEIVDYH